MDPYYNKEDVRQVVQEQTLASGIEWEGRQLKCDRSEVALTFVHTASTM